MDYDPVALPEYLSAIWLSSMVILFQPEGHRQALPSTRKAAESALQADRTAIQLVEDAFQGLQIARRQTLQ